MNWRPPLRGCHAPTRPRHSGWPDASFPAWPPWTPRPGSAVTEGATADLEDNLPSRDCPVRTPAAGGDRPRRERVLRGLSEVPVHRGEEGGDHLALVQPARPPAGVAAAAEGGPLPRPTPAAARGPPLRSASPPPERAPASPRDVPRPVASLVPRRAALG